MPSSVTTSTTNVSSKNNTLGGGNKRGFNNPSTTTPIEFHTPTNGPNNQWSKKKNEKFIRQFRPSVQNDKSYNNTSVKNNNNKSKNNLNIRDKKKLFELFQQFIDSHCVNQ